MSGRGKKDCPKCSTEIGARTQICKCGYDFSSAKKDVAPKEPEKVETPKKEEAYASLVMKREERIREKTGIECIEFVPIKMNSKDHADRILSYGKDRAINLLKCHKSGNTWSHVDWGVVEEGIRGL